MSAATSCATSGEGAPERVGADAAVVLAIEAAKALVAALYGAPARAKKIHVQREGDCARRSDVAHGAGAPPIEEPDAS